MSEVSRIAVFTSGGDAPGMNAAVRAVVRTASYHNLHVYGIYGGYDGMINGKIERLEKKDVGNIMHRGGTILKTARSKEFMTKEGRKKAFENLQDLQIDACVCIGGNGTYTGADVFASEYPIKMIGVPGTIDNDIYGTDYTIGFDTAVNTAIEAVDRIRDTADSHNRLFFIEVMGRHAGFIALNTGIASGAGSVFLPEEEESLEEFMQWLRKSSRRKKLFNLIIVAEGNTEGGATSIAEKVKKEVPEMDTKVTIIGHLQRGGSPSGLDRVLASRLGYGAVNALMDGKSRIAIGDMNNALSYTSFKDAISKTKDLEDDMVQMARILAM